MLERTQSAYGLCVPAAEACVEACHAFMTTYRDSSDPELEVIFGLCRDVADICNLLLRLLDRDSTFVSPLCHVCETACERCAASLDATGDAHLSTLATACHTCAQACRTSLGADV